MASAKHCLKTKAPWVLFVQHQQLQGSLGDLDQNKFDPLRLTFVREPTVSEQQQFLVETQFFEKFPCGHKSLVTNLLWRTGILTSLRLLCQQTYPHDKDQKFLSKIILFP